MKMVIDPPQIKTWLFAPHRQRGIRAVEGTIR
jgi:hypothetical protein